MQDIQLINADQLFPNTASNGGGVVVDRRPRQTHLQNQALKCPRCDSLNTKFCYYNNYNLSQPRHFCKSCRRYWTKGGVLRNVPVGGGCRKSSKRSSAAAAAAKSTTKSSDEVRVKPKSNTSNSSSESSSLTGTGNAAVFGGIAADLAAAPSTSAATPPCTESVFGFGDAKFIFPQIRNPNFTSELLSAADCGGGGDGGIDGRRFSEIGNFSDLNSETATLNFTATSYDAVSPFHQYDRPYEHWQLSTEEAGYIDPTVQIDHQSSNLGSDPLSWNQDQQQPMFGLTSAVDQGYWSQQQWSNADNNAHPHQHLYLP